MAKAKITAKTPIPKPSPVKSTVPKTAGTQPVAPPAPVITDESAIKSTGVPYKPSATPTQLAQIAREKEIKSGAKPHTIAWHTAHLAETVTPETEQGMPVLDFAETVAAGRFQTDIPTKEQVAIVTQEMQREHIVPETGLSIKPALDINLQAEARRLGDANKAYDAMLLKGHNPSTAMAIVKNAGYRIYGEEGSTKTGKAILYQRSPSEKVTLKTPEGKDIITSSARLRAITRLEAPEAQFAQYQKIGVIPKGAVLIPNMQNTKNWEYMTADEASALRNQSPELYETITTEGRRAYDAQVKVAEKAVATYVKAGQLNIGNALTGGISHEQMLMAGYDVTEADIVTAKEYNEILSMRERYEGWSATELLEGKVVNGIWVEAPTDADLKVMRYTITTVEVPPPAFASTPEGKKLAPYLVTHGAAGYEVAGGYDIAHYLRDNPTDKKVLVAAGFTPAAIAEAVEYNNQPFRKETLGEQLYAAIEKKGGNLNTLLTNSTLLRRFLAETGLTKLKKDAIGTDILGKSKFPEPEMGVQEFTENFIYARTGGDKTTQKERNRFVDLALMEYRRLYGTSAASLSLKQLGMKQMAGIIPVVGTVLFWNEMSTPWRIASVALDAFALGAIIPGVRVGAMAGRVGRAFKMPGLQAVQRATQSEVKATIRTLASVDKKLVTSFEGVIKARDTYAKALLRVRDLEKTLKTTYGEVRGEVQSALDRAKPFVEPARQRLLTAGQQFAARQANVQSQMYRKVSKAYGYDLPPAERVVYRQTYGRSSALYGYDSPAVAEATRDLGRNIVRATDRAVEFVINPPQKSLNKLYKTLKVAEKKGDPTEIARIKESIALVQTEQARSIGVELYQTVKNIKKLKESRIAKLKFPRELALLDREIKKQVAKADRLTRELDEALKKFDMQWAKEFTSGSGNVLVSPATTPKTYISATGEKIVVGGQGRFVGGGMPSGVIAPEQGITTTRQRFPLVIPLDPKERLVWVFPQPTTPGIAPGRVPMPEIETFPIGRVTTEPKPETKPAPSIEPTPGTVPVIVPQVRPLVMPEIRPATERQAITSLSPVFADRTRARVQTDVGIKSIMDVGVKTSPVAGTVVTTKPEAKTTPSTEVATKVVPRTATKLTLSLPAPVPTSTPIPTLPTPPHPAIIRLKAKITGNKARLPDGSIAWRQGIFWKWISPQDIRQTSGIRKPRTLRKGITPMGARFTDQRTPDQTIQMIGDSGASVPDVSVDLGVADIYIKDNAQTITYTGKGEQTNVGIGIDSPTKGMTIGGAEAKGHYYAKRVKERRSVSRTADSQEEPVRGKTSVRGISRPKIAEDTKAMLEGTYEEPVEQVKAKVKPQKLEGEEYPDLLAAGYGKETFFDEDPEWLERLRLGIPKVRKKPVNRTKMSKRKPKRGKDNNATTVGGIRL